MRMVRSSPPSMSTRSALSWSWTRAQSRFVINSITIDECGYLPCSHAYHIKHTHTHTHIPYPYHTNMPYTYHIDVRGKQAQV